MYLKAWLRVLLCVFIANVAAIAALADAETAPAPMFFEVHEVDGAIIVAAEGRVTSSTGREFQAFLASLNHNPDAIVLNSLGGRLAGGLELGHAIRDAGLTTHVGIVTQSGIVPGVCASACAYAFLGGVIRQVGDDSHLGFHRIYPAAGQGMIDADTLQAATQAAMAELRMYVLDMGANPGLPDLASSIAADSLYIPQGPVLSALGIETTGLQVAGLTNF